MIKFLSAAQDLDRYGVRPYDVTNAKGSSIVLGVTATGVNLYAKDDALNPKVSFPWAELDKVEAKGEKVKVSWEI